MFDLNDEKQFRGAPAIFNGGEAGLVKNVAIEVEKKDSSDTSNTPDYKIFYVDDIGKINDGIYYFKPNTLKTEEQNKAAEKRLVGRVLSVAKAVLGKDYVFPDVSTKTSTQIIDLLLDLVKQNENGKLVNIYATYGSKQYPSKYLSVRYFDFIEPANTEPTTLTDKKDDLLEILVPETESVTTEDKSWIL